MIIDIDSDAHTRRLQIIAAAYDPEDCESCEVNEGTCTECAIDALEEQGITVPFLTT